LRVEGSGCRVESEGTGFMGSGCRVQSLRFRAQGAGLRVRVQGSLFRKMTVEDRVRPQHTPHASLLQRCKNNSEWVPSRRLLVLCDLPEVANQPRDYQGLLPEGQG